MKTKLLSTCVILLSLPVMAQSRPQARNDDPTTPMFTFRVNVISRTVQAVNYQHRSGSTKLDFAGTDLMPAASGEAKVNSKRGRIEIEAEFAGLQKPTSFGNEYLTYILWAI